VQLQEQIDGFREAGLGVVGLTYDAPAQQQAFIDRFGIDYPMLSDIDAASVRALGILNTDYQPGDSAYGIPYPGVYVVDGDGIIRAKVFVEGYATRVDAAGVLRLAREALNLDVTAASPETPAGLRTD
jgi:peroxiredoxin